MVIFLRNFAILLLLTSLAGCDNRQTKKANDQAAKVFRAWNDYSQELKKRYEKVEAPEIPDVLPESVSKAVDEHSSKIAEAAGAAAAQQATEQVSKRIGSELDQVQRKAGEIGSAASKTTGEVKRTARYYARKVPRSQREANQAVEQQGRKWAQQFDSWLRKIGADGGIFGRRANSSSSRARAKAKTESRLKGRPRK